MSANVCDSNVPIIKKGMNFTVKLGYWKTIKVSMQCNHEMYWIFLRLVNLTKSQHPAFIKLNIFNWLDFDLRW